MLNWLHRSSGANGGSNDAVFHVDDKDPEITAEPIFDEEPALYILYPHAKNPGSQAPKETKISGNFLMTLKKPCHIMSIVAKVIPHYWFKYDKLHEKGTLPPLLCQVLDTSQQLAAGEYELPFTFQFPCDSWCRAYTVCPPGFPDNGPFFSQFYTFELHVTRFASSSSSTSSASPLLGRSVPKFNSASTSSSSSTSNSQGRTETVIIPFPTRRDLKYMHGDHDRWRNGYNRRFFALVWSLSEPGELPPPLERAIEEFAPQLGPINLILTSRSLTISALINFSVSLPAFPRSSQLQEIRGFVEGNGTWKSLQPGGLSFPGIPYRLPVFTLTEKDFELEEDEANGSGQSEHTVKLSGATTYRLPDDRNIGPSTPKGVKSPAKSHHALVFEFHVLAEGGHKKIITIREKVEIASCYLIPEYLNLPTYGSEPVSKLELQPQRPAERFACVCGFTFEQLIQRESEGIVLSVEEYEPPEIKGPEHRQGMD